MNLFENVLEQRKNRPLYERELTNGKTREKLGSQRDFVSKMFVGKELRLQKAFNLPKTGIRRNQMMLCSDDEYPERRASHGDNTVDLQGS